MSTTVPWFRYGLRDTLRALRRAKRRRSAEDAACWSDALCRIQRQRDKPPRSARLASAALLLIVLTACPDNEPRWPEQHHAGVR